VRVFSRKRFDVTSLFAFCPQQSSFVHVTLYIIWKRVKCGLALVAYCICQFRWVDDAGQHCVSASHSCRVTYPTITRIIYDRIKSYRVTDTAIGATSCRHAAMTNFSRSDEDTGTSTPGDLTAAGSESRWKVSVCRLLPSGRFSHEISPLATYTLKYR